MEETLDGDFSMDGSLSQHIAASQAARRDAAHAGQPVTNDFSDDRQLLGMQGETAFGEFSGLYPHTHDGPYGDGGIDFTVPLKFTVDVKTTTFAGSDAEPMHLKHFVGHQMADIFVLAYHEQAQNSTRLMGWCWKSELKDGEKRQFPPHNRDNYCLPVRSLHPMRELRDRLIRIGR